MSSEILDDVLKRLDKLGLDKRKKVLDRLIAANVFDSEPKKNRKQTIPPATKFDSEKSSQATTNEAAILNWHESKGGTYERERSEYKNFSLNLVGNQLHCPTACIGV